MALPVSFEEYAHWHIVWLDDVARQSLPPKGITMKSRLVFHVLRALRSAERESGAGELDLRARELLRIIGEEDERGESLSVGQLVKSANLGTAPTVYSALNQLESQGWIERSSDQPDGRTRRLILSPRARKMFTRAYRIASVALGDDDR